MKKRALLLMGTLLIVLFGVVVPPSDAVEEIVQTRTVLSVSKQEDLIRVADNVVILFDTSSSMGEKYKNSGMTKLQAAKKLLQQRAETFPDVFPELKVGLYTYTPPPSLVDLKGYRVFYKMQPFNKEDFSKAVESLPDKASGTTLLQNALKHLGTLLDSLTGRTVVFLFTDGSYTESADEETPLELAKALAKKHDVSFKIISNTSTEEKEIIIEAVASINASSRVYPIETLLDRPEAYTGAVYIINESYIVSAENREEVVGFELDHILFDFDKKDIKVEFTDELKAVGEILKKKPNSYIVLAGFTDSRGSEEYNLGLSRHRAESVGAYLMKQFQIDRSRILLVWYGEAAPIANNETEAGRIKNRRVLGFVGGVK
jgi:OmpA-OmpF porin, OOP family